MAFGPCGFKSRRRHQVGVANWYSATAQTRRHAGSTPAPDTGNKIPCARVDTAVMFDLNMCPVLEMSSTSAPKNWRGGHIFVQARDYQEALE